ncbi:hypothetical protein AYI69_g5919 [Smittium culicis]|uniref:Uncharacterized protein n=1 Tax=Smittium culicis TaxID=133412 RepID=A0A1R1Y2T1_9FUNG|nr:hypothetical protein AYI69_g5919 [Smittium culicis]
MAMALVQIVHRAELVLDAVPKHRRSACRIGAANTALPQFGGRRDIAPARAGHRDVPLHAVHVDERAFDNAQLDLLVNVQLTFYPVWIAAIYLGLDDFASKRSKHNEPKFN